ncbi:MAG: phenylpyruvate tautomerase MIF-related protein [Bacillota bacterium]|nr:phenylpyruvate tautomerase MIF-related protein [Bacillota bacterium]
MPYINSTVTVAVSEDAKENIKSRLGEVISEIPGKSESWLMVGFNENQTLYFRGERLEKAAFIEVKVYGQVERKYKERVAPMIFDVFEEELGIPRSCAYLTITEVEDWGWNGELFEK